jgi:hypothetical protein
MSFSSASLIISIDDQLVRFLWRRVNLKLSFTLTTHSTVNFWSYIQIVILEAARLLTWILVEIENRKTDSCNVLWMHLYKDLNFDVFVCLPYEHDYTNNQANIHVYPDW